MQLSLTCCTSAVAFQLKFKLCLTHSLTLSSGASSRSELLWPVAFSFQHPQIQGSCLCFKSSPLGSRRIRSNGFEVTVGILQLIAHRDSRSAGRPFKLFSHVCLVVLVASPFVSPNQISSNQIRSSRPSPSEPFPTFMPSGFGRWDSATDRVPR